MPTTTAAAVAKKRSSRSSAGNEQQQQQNGASGAAKRPTAGESKPISLQVDFDEQYSMERIGASIVSAGIL